MSSYDPKAVQRAAVQVAGLYAYGHTPDPEVEAHARRGLATARIDREIRQSLASSGALDAAQTGHLVGLILSHGGQDEHAVERLARALRDGIYATPNLTNDDKLALAQVALGSA